MKLIKEVESRKDIRNHYIKWGEFLCPNPICNRIVERPLSDGLKTKSCGCMMGNIGRVFIEEHRQKIGQANKGKKRTEEQNKKQSERMRGENNPSFGKIYTEEDRQKISLGNKGKKRTEEQNKKQSEAQKGKHVGELNRQWQGGKSFEIYPQEFKQIKKFILERDNYECQCPGCEHKSNKLDIHHIDYDKKNNVSENLITLCTKCHGKTIGKKKRQYYTEFYQNIMENKI